MQRARCAKNAPAWLIIILLVTQIAIILALRRAPQYILVLPVFFVDILVTAVPLRAFLKALRGLVLGSVIFSLAVLFTNQNGKELIPGVIYSEGLEEAILLIAQFTLLGLASQASLHRFGQGAALRALAIGCAPLRVFGVSAAAAARVLYRTFGLMPLIFPRFLEMIKKRRIDIRALLDIRGSKQREAPVRLRTRRVCAQACLCVLWLACALGLALGLEEVIARALGYM
jgi:hypothetical protein